MSVDLEIRSVGKGKKICNSCFCVTGARKIICDCGYNFHTGETGCVKEIKVVEPKIFDEPGKGRKQCDSCHKYVAARSIECGNCGSYFSQKLESIKEEVSEDIPQRKLTEEELFAFSAGFNHTAKVIHTPSGKCPHSFELNRDSVHDWCDLILSYGRKDNKVYLPEAMKYWSRDFYNINSKEYQEISSYINEWADQLEGNNEMFEDSESDSSSD